MRSLAILHPRGTPATGGLSQGWWRDAADVLAVADALDLHTFDILAHSAGTRLALAVSAQYPERVRSMALVTPAAAWLTGADHDGPVIAARRATPLVDAALASMAAEEPANESEFQRALVLEAPAGYAKWTAGTKHHSTVGAMSLAAASAWFNNIPLDAARSITESLRPPTLVVGGTHDILSGVDPVRAYAKALGARLTVLEDCGHYPWIEQPETFRRVLGGWVDR
ncbi:alpha/beta fold hydrolase [Arthrobacter sp. zg-Y1171]|uniref:alpha/beta fold hydrolase n=1 Tax=Arthrobacter sp. zg-Y1171 TaxID=2964610 RepID=UPI002103BA0D|nr:alpha/beta hydrolase [Arthrobacter sp. zg-Y1171]MCQ1996157.1 alpha/beta hydrolase [Arthrobacter sp. zg-Y1171]UWX82784.1 alpha/beta hydrolase [Arthrobacter sp. zg-Y1171]